MIDRIHARYYNKHISHIPKYFCIMASRPSLETLPEELIEIVCSHLDIESKAAIALLQLVPRLKDKYLREYREYRVKLANELTRVLQDKNFDPDFTPQSNSNIFEYYRDAMATLIKLLKLRPVRGPVPAEQYAGLYKISYIGDKEVLREADYLELEKIMYTDEEEEGDDSLEVIGNYWSKRLGRLIDLNFESYRTIGELTHTQGDLNDASDGYINDLAEAMKSRINLPITTTTTPALIDYLCRDSPNAIEQKHIRGSRVMQPQDNDISVPSYSTVYWRKTGEIEYIVWVHSKKPLTDLKQEHFAEPKTFRMRTILRKIGSRWSILEWREELGSTIYQLLLNELYREDKYDPQEHVFACGFEDTTLFG